MKQNIKLLSSIIRSVTALIRAHTEKTKNDVRVDVPAFDLRRDQ